MKRFAAVCSGLFLVILFSSFFVGCASQKNLVDKSGSVKKTPLTIDEKIKKALLPPSTRIIAADPLYGSAMVRITGIEVVAVKYRYNDDNSPKILELQESCFNHEVVFFLPFQNESLRFWILFKNPKTGETVESLFTRKMMKYPPDWCGRGVKPKCDQDCALTFEIARE